MTRGLALTGRFVHVVRTRPWQVYGALRCYLLFVLAKWMRDVRGGLPGVTLGENVRVQRNGSLCAELPDAEISIGRDSIVYEHARIEAYGRGAVTIGEGSIIGDARIISRHRITIGKRFLSSWNVFIQDFDPHPLDARRRAEQVRSMTARFKPAFGEVPHEDDDSGRFEFPGAEITIGDDVWAGANVCILKGARIGDGCVIGAGSVVARGEYASNSLIAGNPARVVRSLEPGERE